MADVTKRIKRWDAKFNTDRVKAIIDDIRDDMFQSVQSSFVQVAEMELSVKQVLDGIGLPTLGYPFYLAYGRELLRLRRRGISGESMALEAQVLLDKWVARGLSESALEAIRTQVFDIGAPVTP
jgi:hypothetical protein